MNTKIVITVVFCCGIFILEAGKDKPKLPSIKTTREGSSEGSRASCAFPVPFTSTPSPRPNLALQNNSSNAEFYSRFACFICCCGVKTVDEHQYGYDTIK